MKKERCRHERNSWLIAGGYYEWCFVCGAIRRMRKIKGMENGVTADSKWCKPTGNKEDNPYEKWKDN
jgi:hypothetical protein